VRIHEIVRRHLGEGGRVIAPGTARELITPNMLPEGTVIDKAEGASAVLAAEQGDVVVLIALGDIPAVAEVLELLPADAVAVLVLTVPPEKLPVGAVLETLHASGAQVLDAVAVQRLSTPAVAVVVGHGRPLALPTAYLSRGVGEADLFEALRRIVGEWVLESFVRRAETRLAEVEAKRDVEERSNLQRTIAARDETISSLEMQVERLNELEMQVEWLDEELATCQSRSADRQRRIEHLERSRSVRVGRAVNRVRRYWSRWLPTRNRTN
jgi:hypothetical protein